MMYSLSSSLFLGMAFLTGRIFASPMSTDSGPVGKAVYLQSNEHENSVISITIGHDGKLYGGMTTSTGGMGGAGIDGTTNKPAGPDALSSQGSVVVKDNYLFAVNAGSNTVSMFKIDGINAADLSMIGNPSAVPGDFPVTVAASVKRSLVCVGYTGKMAGVSCAPFTHEGLGPMKQVLDFDLDQTTPPVGPTNTVAEVFFTADDSRLITTVKGDPTTNNTGFISVLPFKDSCSCALQGHDVRTSPPGTAVLFGSVNIPDTSDLFVTDASFGTTILDLHPNTDSVSLLHKTVITGQKATCWAAYSEARNSVFVTDAGRDRLIEIGAHDSKIMSTLDLKNGDPGLTDVKVSGRFVYALSPGNGTTPAAITVVDSFQGQEIQHFQLEKLGGSKRAQGMAILQW